MFLPYNNETNFFNFSEICKNLIVAIEKNVSLLHLY